MLSNVIDNAGSIINSGVTAYPLPGFVILMSVTTSNAIIGVKLASTFGAGNIDVSILAVIFGGLLYNLPPYNSNAAGRSM